MSRRAVVRGTLAFAVGFTGALLTVLAADLTEERADAVERVVGTPDFFEYCRDSIDDRASAHLESRDAYGWRCAARRNGIFDLEPIDAGAVCRFQYGEEAVAETVDATSPYSWRCVALVPAP